MHTIRAIGESLCELHRKLDGFVKKQKHQLTKIMKELDELKAEVARNTTVDASAIALLKGIKAKLDAAGTDPVALKELRDSLARDTDALAAAVVENTPAES